MGGVFVFPWPDHARLAAMKTPEGVDTATEEFEFHGFIVQSSLICLSTELTSRKPAGHPEFKASHQIYFFSPLCALCE